MNRENRVSFTIMINIDMKKKTIAHNTIYLLLLTILVLTGCGTAPIPEGATIQTDPESAATEAPALERVEPQAADELTILITATPHDYPAPTIAPAGSYPIATPVPHDPYAAPEDATDTNSGDGINTADADVTFVRAVHEGGDLWTFHVTVAHPDTGNDDYADGWDVITSDNVVLKANPDDPFTRLLTHPHIDEQPFTRSQSGIAIPEGIEGVFVRAHDLVHGWGGEMVFVDFTQEEGRNFVIERGE